MVAFVELTNRVTCRRNIIGNAESEIRKNGGNMEE